MKSTVFQLFVERSAFDFHIGSFETDQRRFARTSKAINQLLSPAPSSFLLSSSFHGIRTTSGTPLCLCLCLSVSVYLSVSVSVSLSLSIFSSFHLHSLIFLTLFS